MFPTARAGVCLALVNPSEAHVNSGRGTDQKPTSLTLHKARADYTYTSADYTPG